MDTCDRFTCRAWLILGISPSWIARTLGCSIEDVLSCREHRYYGPVPTPREAALRAAECRSKWTAQDFIDRRLGPIDLTVPPPAEYVAGILVDAGD